MLNASRYRSGESRVHVVRCTSPEGKRCSHRVKVMLNGRIALLDHPRGEPSRTLKWLRLAGEPPCGCYAVLHALRTSDAGCTVSMLDRYGLVSPQARFIQGVVSARRAVRMLRAALCHGGLAVLPVPSVGRQLTWVVSPIEETAQAVAQHGPPGVLRYAPTRTGVDKHSGFVQTSILGEGAILWDMVLVGIVGLEESPRGSPERASLLHLTRKLLRRWGAKRSTLKSLTETGPEQHPSEPCRPSP